MHGMKAKVLLIYPHLHNKEFFFSRMPPLGLEYIASAIRGLADVRILDCRFGKSVSSIVEEFEPDIVGISVLNCVRAHDAYHAASVCRRSRSILIIGGGLHATLCPDEALGKGFDAVVRGEGEDPFAAIVRTGGLRGVKGISLKERGKTIHRPSIPLSKNLDDIPQPARDLRSPETDYSMNRGLMKVDLLATSRGCTGTCDFCSPAVYYKGRWRAHSPEYVLKDLRRIEAPWVVVTDDHFMGDESRVEEICDRIIAEGIRKSFFIQTRMVQGGKDLKRKMLEAGFRMITFGVEGTSEKSVRRYRKSMRFDEIKGFIRDWREAGAELINGSFVFAHPDDSREDLLSFGDYAREIDLDFADFIFLTPYPGTKIHREYEKKGAILTKDWRRYTQGTLLVEHPELDDQEMRNAKRMAFLRFMSPRKVSRMLGMVGSHFAGSRKDDGDSFVSIKAIYIGYLNRHLLFGNHYEASAFAGLPEYGGGELTKRELLRIYFREQINRFPKEERDVTEGLNSLLRSAGLTRPARLLGNRRFSVVFKDGPARLTSLHVEMRGGEILSAIFDADAEAVPLKLSIDINDIPVLEGETIPSHAVELFGIILRKMMRFFKKDRQSI
ncbi:B12-binding domain-containing radical SAM protein [Thermodesulfobacteriota bacterium]